MQKKQLTMRQRKILFVNLLCALLVFVGGYWQWSQRAVSVAAVQSGRPAAAGFFDGQEILYQGIPGLERHVHSKDETLPARSSWKTAADKALYFLFAIDGKDAKSVLRAELPWLPAASEAAAPAPADLLAKRRIFSSGEPLVGIYHTHTAESFEPSTGVTHRPGGQKGEICALGGALAETLEKNGIAAVQDTTIHDYPSFMKAYGASEVTVKKMVREYPSLQMVFDVHRDAEKRENVVTEINGESVAKVSIIVAQGQADLPQPHWRVNYALAKQIDQKCNEKYPNLSRGIQLVEWRYNQHLHPHALLLEVGSHETTTEEGVRAMQLLGDVLTEILREGISDPK